MQTKKHKRRFITDTPQIITGRAWAILEDDALSDMQKLQALNTLRKEVIFTGAGFYSDERRAIDDFMARHAKHLQTRSA